MDVKDTLIQFIQHDLIDDEQPFNSDEDLLTTGLIDSVRVMRLVNFVGEAFASSSTRGVFGPLHIAANPKEVRGCPA